MGELHLARSIDADLATWLALTLILGGAGAFATGRALATTWQSAWRLVPYMGALAGVDGFLCWALFDVPVISLARLAGEAAAGDIPGFLSALEAFGLTFALLWAIGGASFVITRRQQMRRQYPFLFGASAPMTEANGR